MARRKKSVMEVAPDLRPATAAGDWSTRGDAPPGEAPAAAPDVPSPGLNRFGAALFAALDARSLSQSALAAEIDTSRAYVSAVMRGTTLVSPERIEEISDRIGLSDAERVRLHRGAAQDRGFRLDLPDDF